MRMLPDVAPFWGLLVLPVPFLNWQDFSAVLNALQDGRAGGQASRRVRQAD